MACPSADQLLGFAAGNLTDDQSASVESHIDGCSECRGALSNLARGDAPPSFGRYRIDTVLGSGGMGIVYRAWDPQLARALAIKVVRRAGEDEAGRARLVREAQALARVSHPNVCHVYDVGTDGDEVWVAMELIDGASLRQWAGERRDAGDLMRALIGAAEGIAAAHAAGIVHRDVKPENVLVTRDGRAVVTDFGLARPQDNVDPNASTISTDPHLTQTGAIAGTPAYLAPEQLTQDPIDARVDQFAWAVMAWELLTGIRPFPVIFAARLEAIRAGLTPPPTLSKPVAAALTKAMAVAPADRFASMKELVEALRAEPLRADTPKPSRPRRSALAAGLAATLLVAGGGAYLATRHSAVSSLQSPVSKIGSSDVRPSAVTSEPSHPDAGAVAVAPAVAVAVAAPPPSPSPPRPRKPPTATATVTATVPSAAAAAAIAGPPPPPRLPDTSSHFARGNAIAVMSAFCHVPYDFAHPDPATRTPLADYGKVVSSADEPGQIGDRIITEHVITIAGQRGTYRISDDLGAIGTLVVAPGDLVALCVEDEANTYQLPNGPLTLTHTAFRISKPPRTAEIARNKALHVTWGAFYAPTGKLTLDPDRRYLVHDTVGAKDPNNGTHFEMTNWILDVPTAAPGAALVAPGKTLWFVVEEPTQAADANGKQVTTARATAVIDDLFP